MERNIVQEDQLLVGINRLLRLQQEMREEFMGAVEDLNAGLGAVATAVSDISDSVTSILGYVKTILTQESTDAEVEDAATKLNAIATTLQGQSDNLKAALPAPATVAAATAPSGAANVPDTATPADLVGTVVGTPVSQTVGGPSQTVTDAPHL